MRKFVTRIATVASLTLAAVPALGLTQAASAAPREPVARVAFGDLNLANPTQAKIFKARVEAAGQQLCQQKLDTGNLATTMFDCRASVRREIDRQLPAAQQEALAAAARSQASEFAAK